MFLSYIHYRTYFSIGALLSAGVVFLIHGSSAFARSGFSSELKSSSVYDTNPLARSDNLESSEIFGLETTASLIFANEKASQALSAGLSFSRNQFNDSDFNSNDISLSLRAQRQIKRWFLSFTGRGVRDTTRISTNDVLGQGNIVVGNRTSFFASPSVVYNYSDRNSIGLNIDWQRRSYDDKTGLVDYRTYSLSPFVSRKLSKLQDLSLALLYQDYQSTDGQDNGVKSLGPFATWKYNFQRNMMLELSFGLLRTEFDGIGTTARSETNPTYSANLEYNGQLNTASLTMERSRQPSSNGSEVDFTSIGISNTYEISPRWNIDLNADYRKSKQSGFSSGNLDSSYGGSVGATYDISRQLKFSTSYRYLNESFIDNDSDASRNIIRAGVEYSLY